MFFIHKNGPAATNARTARTPALLAALLALALFAPLCLQAPAHAVIEAVMAGLASEKSSDQKQSGADPYLDAWAKLDSKRPTALGASPARIPGPNDDYDLETSVVRALAANPRILSVRAQLDSSEAQVDAARAAFGFRVDLSYNYQHRDLPQDNSTTTRDDLWTMNLRLTQPLFTGFNLLNSFQRSKLAREQAEARILDTELFLIQDVQTAFLTLLRARDDERSAEDAVTRLKSQLEVSKAFFDVGLRPRLDVLQTEADLARAEQDLATARSLTATQIVRLNTLLGLPYANKTTYVGALDYPAFTLQQDPAVDRALRSRPDLDIARKAVDVARKDVGIAESQLYPQVRGQFDYDRRGDDPSATGTRTLPDGDTWTAGVYLNWQLFDFGRTQANVRAAEHQVTRVAADYVNLLKEATFETASNHLAVNEAGARVASARAGLDAAREGFRVAQARYQAQVGAFTDVLDAQARLTRAEADLTRALADRLTALARLYRSMGKKNPGLMVE